MQRGQSLIPLMKLRRAAPTGLVDITRVGELADDIRQEEGVLRLKLVPRQPQADVERATVDVEPRGRIRAILLEDVQGNRTRFRFEAQISARLGALTRHVVIRG